MEPNRTDLTKEEILREQIAIDIVTPLCKSSVNPDEVADAVLNTVVSYSEQKEKPLLERIKSLEQALEELMRGVEYSRFQFKSTGIKTGIEKAKQVLNTKS